MTLERKKKIKNIVFAILLLLILIICFGGALAVKSQNTILKEQVVNAERQIQTLQDKQEKIFSGVSEVRSYMNLPQLSEDHIGDLSNEGEAPKISSFEVASYDALSYLKKYNKEQEDLNRFYSWLDKLKSHSYFSSLGLSLKKSDNKTFLINYNRTLLVKLSYKEKDNQIILKEILNNEEREFSLESDSLEPYFKKCISQLNQAKLDFKTSQSLLVNLLKDQSLRSFLHANDLYWAPREEGTNSLVLKIIKKDRSPFMSLSANLKNPGVEVGQKNFLEEKGLISYIRKEVLEGDKRTDREVYDDKVKEALNSLLEDTPFQAHLKQLEFQYSTNPREDNDYYYYDFTNNKGELQGAFGVQKDFGTIYLMDKEDIPIRALKSFSDDFKILYPFEQDQKIKSSADSSLFLDNPENKTILLVGSHEHNADTIILAYFDSAQKGISLISIPRDLYYKGRKINSIFRTDGASGLAAVLSPLTGLRIDDYAAIDMYAFIDVINLLGGIDITLDEPLIDPTYKIRENGRWSTLYYEAGEHRLDGVGALRVVRSRHSSSDFERSIRQQKIIVALKEKLGQIGLKDITKLYDAMQIGARYLDTNMSPSDMVKDLLSYKDYSIKSQNVINTDNILYWSYSNLYKLPKEEQDKKKNDPSFYKGAWIVRPKGEDWSLIKTYIQGIIE